MGSLILTIVYISFVSLGLPDSLLGAGWPVMQAELGVPLAYAGIISMIIAGGTIISSLLSASVLQKMNTGMVTALSVGLTAVALFGFSVSHSFVMLCLFAVPYGLGAGAVDSALNHYAAVHFSSKHMSWLHACWGVGVSVSPYVMSLCLTHNLGWNMGYRFISVAQMVLTLFLFCSLPLWRKSAAETEEAKTVSVRQALRGNGVASMLIAFFGFCAFEATAGLWASSYMVDVRGVNVQLAARFAALFYLGETAGRFLNGLIADRFGDRCMIRVGILVMLFGTLLMLLPAETDWFALFGLLIIGLGAAPVYPCIIHATPHNFGKESAKTLVSIQIASAYCGSTFMPPLFGLLAEHISVSLYPLYLLLLAVLMLVMTSVANRRIDGLQIAKNVIQ